MSEISNLQSRIRDELERIEEDSSHSGKAHFNAASRWACWHYIVGIPSIVLASAAGTAFFKDYAVAAGAMSSAVAVLAGLTTFLKPSERSATHKTCGSQYLALKNDCRVARTITLLEATNEKAEAALAEMTKRRNDLNTSSPQFSQGDYQRAKKGIDAGEALHAVDRR